MKIGTLLLILSFTHAAFGQNTKPYSSLMFDKVIMYDFNCPPEGEDVYIVNPNGKLSKDILKQIELTADEVNSLNSKIENKKSYGEATAACFDPHLGFVYYLNGKIVAHITVCIECNRLHSSLDIPAQKQGKVSIGADTYYAGTGLSNSFKVFINSMLIKYNFSHQLHKP